MGKWEVDTSGWLQEHQTSIAEQTDVMEQILASCVGSDVVLQREVILRNDAARSKPITFSRQDNPTQTKEYEIYLALRDSWDYRRFLYQAGHEFGHVLMECYPRKECFKWISECLCSAISMYIMHRMKRFFPEQKKFYKDYRNSVFTRPKEILANHESVLDFYTQNKLDFWLDPEGPNENGVRTRNGVVELSWLEIIKKNPSAMKSVIHMDDSSIDLPPSGAYTNCDIMVHEMTTLFFQTWKSNCQGDAEKVFARDIAASIGYELLEI